MTTAASAPESHIPPAPNATSNAGPRQRRQASRAENTRANPQDFFAGAGEETRPGTANPETLVRRLEPQSQNNSGGLVRGLKAVNNFFQKPVFAKCDPEKDFFYGAKVAINKIWNWTPVWLPTAATTGGIATGVAFGILYKTALIGALSGFFVSNHVGWVVGGAIGATLLVAGVVMICRYFEHKRNYQANQEIKKAASEIVSLREQVLQLQRTGNRARTADAEAEGDNAADV